MSDLLTLAKRLREPINGRMVTMCDSVIEITVAVPPVAEAADRLEAIERALPSIAESIDARLHDSASPARTAIILGIIRAAISGEPAKEE